MRSFILKSLRIRVLLMVVLISVPAFALTLWTADEQQELAVAQAQTDALEFTRSLASSNEQYITNGRQLLVTLSHLPAIQNQDLGECNRILAELLATNQSYINIFLIDTATGQRICSGLLDQPPVDNTGFSWYQQVLSQQTFVVSDYRIGPISKKPLITLGYPVYDEEDHLNGVIAVGVSLEWLNTFIQDNSLPDNSAIIIIDSQGTVLVRYPELVGIAGTTYANDKVREAAMTQPEGTLSAMGLDGEPRLYGYTQIALGQGHMSAIVGLNEPTVLADANRIRNRNLLALGFITIVTILFTWFGSAIVLSPVKSLTTASRQIAAGRLDSRTRLAAPVIELQELLSSFNEMATSIEAQAEEQMSELTATNQRLRHEIEERKEAQNQTHILQELAVGLSEAITPEQVGQAIVEHALRLLNSYRSLVAVFDSEKNALRTLAMHGFPPEIASQFEIIALDSKFPITETYIHNRPYWIETVEAYQAQFPEGYEKLKPVSTTQAIACLPLTINKQVAGSILIAFTYPQVMDEPFRDLMLTIAGYCSQALERALAYNNEQSARAAAETAQQRIAFLSEASVVLSTSLDTQAILEHLAQMIVPRLADWCFITLEPKHLIIHAADQNRPLIEAIIESHPSEHRAESHLIIDIDQIPNSSLPSANLLHTIGAISYIHVPLSSRGHSRGMLGFATSQFHYTSADLQLAEELAGRVALAIENAQLYAAEHLLRQAAERTSNRIARLQEATASLLRSLTLTKVAEIALEQVAASLNTSTGIITLCRDEALSLIHGVGYPTDQIDLWKTLDFNDYPDLASCTPPSESQWIKEIPESFTQIPFVQAKYRALAVLPLTIEAKNLGVIVLCFEEPQEFTIEDQAFVTALIHNSVQALERALLYDEAQKVAILEERNRLARDLHDAVTQVLFSSSVLSEALLRKKDLDNEKTRIQLERLHRLNRGALAEMRSLLLELRPARLVETTIDELLEQLANAIMGRKDILIEVNASKGCVLPPDVQIAYYRIAQEVLNNIVKHSEASQVTLNFQYNENYSELLIQDNGRGFDPQAVTSLDSGIGFMRERAKNIGADLTITSNNSGTVVQLRSAAIPQEAPIMPGV